MRRFLPVLRDYPPPPTLGDVLYVKPAPGRAGRLCSNCIFWVVGSKCSIHSPRLVVTGGMVCGYHVHGRPLDQWIEFPGIQRVEPETSGLVNVGGIGTMCGNCMWFAGDGSAGSCKSVGTLVQGGWQPASVDFYGCCSRWRGRR